MRRLNAETSLGPYIVIKPDKKSAKSLRSRKIWENDALEQN